MMDRTLLLWWHLGILNKKRYEALLQVHGDLRAALEQLGPELLRALGCRPDTIRRVMERREALDVDQYSQQIMQAGVGLVAIDDPQYPALLRQAADPPVFLSYRGDLAALGHPCLALVGTRRVSAYGRRVTEEFTASVARAGMVTVSGLAAGVDSLVAAETMRAGGRTVAVLGHGLQAIFPRRNSQLAEDIVQSGGLLLSEFPYDQPPDIYTFPARNRIIAGVSVATVVLEAPEGSGALITAECAFSEGRDVFAVPGQIFDGNYHGCHRLILRQQARIATGADDVLREMGVVAPDRSGPTFVPGSPEEEKLHGILTAMPQSFDDLVMKSGLSSGQVSATLTMMELAGGARNVGGGNWVRG